MLFSFTLLVLICVLAMPTQQAAAKDTFAIRTVVEDTQLLANDYVTPLASLQKSEVVILHYVEAGWAYVQYKGMDGVVPATTLRTAQATSLVVTSKNPPIVRQTTEKEVVQLGHLPLRSVIHTYQTNDSNYLFVQYGELSGYVLSAAFQKPKSQKMIVSSKEGLAVKSTMSKAEEPFATIATKTVVEVYTTVEGWAYVATGNKVEGYVLASGLKEIPKPKLGRYSQGVATKTKRIALTFDDGPHPTVTKQVLATLEKYDAKATFFVTGHRVSKSPKVLQAIYDAGHEIGNHTWSHPQLTKISSSQALAQINETSRIVQSVIGEEPTLFRPPYGAYNKAILSSLSVPMIMWSVDTLDWQHRTPAKTLKAVQNGAYNGSIILMHDIHQPTADALDSVMSYLSKQGYEFVTVSEIIMP